MKMLRLLLTLCGMLFTGIGFADEIDGMRFMHIGLEDGLSHSTILGINQDKEGNLWFATYDGLNKYDGYNFTVYRHYQNFYEFPKFRIKLLILILLHFNIVRIIY